MNCEKGNDYIKLSQMEPRYSVFNLNEFSTFFSYSYVIQQFLKDQE